MTQNFKMRLNILADSRSHTGRVITILTEFPYSLLPELEKHRNFSFSIASTRAVPNNLMLEKVKKNPHYPNWNMANRGMQGLPSGNTDQEVGNQIWRDFVESSLTFSKKLADSGFHKQVCNLPLIPILKVDVVMTATYEAYQDLFNLRISEAAKPDFREYAEKWKSKIEESRPLFLNPGQWHIPFIDDITEFNNYQESLKVSASCCARTSYANSKKEDLEVHYKRHDKCLEEKHWGVFEHQLRVPVNSEMNEFTTFWYKVSTDSMFFWKRKNGKYCSNIGGWIQYRKILENEEKP